MQHKHTPAVGEPEPNRPSPLLLQCSGLSFRLRMLRVLFALEVKAAI